MTTIKQLQEKTSRKIVGTVNGQQWWSNGHVMFLGKLRGEHETKNCQKVYDEATKRAALIPLTMDETSFTTNLGAQVYALKSQQLKPLYVQKQYGDYLREKDFRLFAGNKFDTSYFVICKNGDDQIVGIVAPVRA